MAANWKIGDKIKDRYEIINIKMGGMGIVYLCYDSEEGLPLAIKTFHERFLFDEDARDRFTREALIWVELGKHRNIVRALIVLQIEGQPYIFLEYIPGESLNVWIEERRLDLLTALDFAVQFCNGMEYASNKLGGIVHRDIKPSNMLIGPGNVVKVTDFGLAKAALDKGKEKETGKVRLNSFLQSGAKGTLPWMAPEQFFQEEIDTRADIYSFGIVLYQMITGKYPYPIKIGTPEEFYVNHLKGKQVPLLKVNSDIPVELNSLVTKCLEKKPRNRYQNFAQLKQDLSNIYRTLTGRKLVLAEGEELDVNDLLNKGVSLAMLGRPEEAIEFYDNALKINPRDADAWANKGTALRRLKKLEQAIECHDEALEINPRLAMAWTNKGSALGDLGKFEQAIECHDKALEINPRLAMTWTNKGAVLDHLGKFEQAIECHDKALEINPRYALAWANKGTALRALGKFEQAIECSDKALEINPRDAEAWTNKGTALEGLEKFEQAIECYDKALEINPRLAEAWYNKGIALEGLEKFEQAIECFDRALEINPRDADAWALKGTALGGLGKFEQAIECSDKALEINPKDADAWALKGTALDDLGKFEQAIECYDKALEINPRDAEAWNNKAIVFYRLGKIEQAIECYDKALEINPRDAEAWTNKGTALDDLGKLEILAKKLSNLIHK